MAHNGLGFDFPLLRAELLKSESDLGPEVLVVDSLDAFKHIFAEQNAADDAELVRQLMISSIIQGSTDISVYSTRKHAYKKNTEKRKKYLARICLIIEQIIP